MDLSSSASKALLGAAAAVAVAAAAAPGNAVGADRGTDEGTAFSATSTIASASPSNASVCGGHRRLHAGAPEQHVLVDAWKVRHACVARERLGNAADLFALGVVLVAVRKRGQEGDGENGFLLVQVHGVLPARRWVKTVVRSPGGRSRAWDQMQSRQRGFNATACGDLGARGNRVFRGRAGLSLGYFGVEPPAPGVPTVPTGLHGCGGG